MTSAEAQQMLDRELTDALWLFADGAFGLALDRLSPAVHLVSLYHPEVRSETVKDEIYEEFAARVIGAWGERADVLEAIERAIQS